MQDIDVFLVQEGAACAATLPMPTLTMMTPTNHAQQSHPGARGAFLPGAARLPSTCQDLAIRLPAHTPFSTGAANGGIPFPIPWPAV